MDAKLAEYQHTRMRMIRVSTMNYLVGSMALAIYAIAGSVDWGIPLIYFSVTLSGSLVFLTMVKKGWNLRFRDHTMLMPQMLFAGCVLLGTLWWLPKLAFILLSGLFVTSLFGALQMERRQIIAAWLFVAVGLAAVFAHVWHDLDLPASTPLEAALLWITIMLSLTRFIVVNAHLNALRQKLRERNMQLEHSVKRIEELAYRDELTGALNRRSFMAKLEEERGRAERGGQVFCVALLDLDHFKSVNDRYGHLLGDTVLRSVCQLVDVTKRTTDFFGRYGGEEFIMLLTDTPPHQAQAAIDRIREVVELHDWEQIAPDLRVTISIGLTTYSLGEGTATFLDRADRALYDAKRCGRNRVVERVA